MITAPMLTHKVKIDLPQPSPNPVQDNPQDPIRLKIDRSGALYWNDAAVDEDTLKAQMSSIGSKPVAAQPELQINADDSVAYEAVARVLSDAKSYGLTKIGFTEGQ